jgi:hypothetical protein
MTVGDCHAGARAKTKHGCGSLRNVFDPWVKKLAVL